MSNVDFFELTEGSEPEQPAAPRSTPGSRETLRGLVRYVSTIGLLLGAALSATAYFTPLFSLSITSDSLVQPSNDSSAFGSSLTVSGSQSLNFYSGIYNLDTSISSSTLRYGPVLIPLTVLLVLLATVTLIPRFPRRTGVVTVGATGAGVGLAVTAVVALLSMRLSTLGRVDESSTHHIDAGLWLMLAAAGTAAAVAVISALSTHRRPSAQDLDHCYRAEARLLDPQVRADAHQLDALLAVDFNEIGASGRVWTREQIIDAMTATAYETAHQTPPPDPAQMSDVTTLALGPDLVQVRYLSDNGGRRAYRSSLWRRNGDTWQVVFHQGTEQDAEQDT